MQKQNRFQNAFELEKFLSKHKDKKTPGPLRGVCWWGCRVKQSCQYLNYQHLLEPFGKNIFIKKNEYFSLSAIKTYLKMFVWLFWFSFCDNAAQLTQRVRLDVFFARGIHSVRTRDLLAVFCSPRVWVFLKSPTHCACNTHSVTCCKMVESDILLRNKKNKTRNKINPSKWSLRQAQEIKIEPDKIKKYLPDSFLCKYLFLAVKISFPFYFSYYLKMFTDLGLQLIRLCRFVSRRGFSFITGFFCH